MNKHEAIKFLHGEAKGCNMFADRVEKGETPKATSTPEELRARANKFIEVADMLEAEL